MKNSSRRRGEGERRIMQKLRGDIENLRLGEESDVTCNAEMRFSETKTRSWVCKDTLGPVS